MESGTREKGVTVAYSKGSTKPRREAPDYLSKTTAVSRLQEAIEKPGLLRQIPTAHVLSIGNQWFVVHQNAMEGREGSISGPFGFWKGIGRRVKKGADGMFVLTPIPFEVDRKDKFGNVMRDANGKVLTDTRVSFKLRPSRFDLSQTEGPDVEFPEVAFDLGGLLCALEVELVPFTMDDNACGGYCYGTDDGDFLAINPLYPDPLGVLLHELAHIVLGHTQESRNVWVSDADRTPRDLRELGAEGTNLILQSTLGNTDAEAYSRGYMQNWNREKYTEMPERAADDIFAAGNIIYRAGLGLLKETDRIRLRKPKKAE
jgi:hypothetical protein